MLRARGLDDDARFLHRCPEESLIRGVRRDPDVTWIAFHHRRRAQTTRLYRTSKLSTGVSAPCKLGTGI